MSTTPTSEGVAFAQGGGSGGRGGKSGRGQGNASGRGGRGGRSNSSKVVVVAVVAPKAAEDKAMPVVEEAEAPEAIVPRYMTRNTGKTRLASSVIRRAILRTVALSLRKLQQATMRTPCLHLQML